MSTGEVDWEVFAEHLRAQGEEHVLDEYPEYAEYLRGKAPKAGDATAGVGDPAVQVPDPAAGASVQVIERIVEVLVIRCKFCQELSPVELEKCRSCGEAGFY